MTLQVKEQLVRMVRIQELALDISRAQGVIEAAPSRMDEIEQRFRDRAKFELQVYMPLVRVK